MLPKNMGSYQFGRTLDFNPIFLFPPPQVIALYIVLDVGMGDGGWAYSLALDKPAHQIFASYV